MAIDQVVRCGANARRPPIGATGEFLTTRLSHAMPRDSLRRGSMTLCIGGGQGVAVALERIRPMCARPITQGLDPCAAPGSRLTAQGSARRRVDGEPR